MTCVEGQITLIATLVGLEAERLHIHILVTFRPSQNSQHISTCSEMSSGPQIIGKIVPTIGPKALKSCGLKSID